MKRWTDRLKIAVVIFTAGAVLGAAAHDWFVWQTMAAWPVWMIGGLFFTGALSFILQKP